VLDPERGRAKRKSIFATLDENQEDHDKVQSTGPEGEAISEHGYLESERQADLDLSKQKKVDGTIKLAEAFSNLELENMSRKQRDEAAGRVVDVVLSDMSEPWEQTSGFGKRSISDPYIRMMNTSGTPFRDHAGSMVSIQLDKLNITIINGINPGPLYSRPILRFRHTSYRWEFCCKVLSRI